MEYAFTFTFALREFPPTSVSRIVSDSINRPGDLLTFKSLVTRAMCFHRANLGLPGRVRSRHATDRQTDRHRASFHNAPPYGGRRHNKSAIFRGLKAKLKAKEMLERLEVVLRGCVCESALNGNCLVSLD